MFAFLDRPVRLCEGFARRELLRIGGLSAMGLTPRPSHEGLSVFQDLLEECRIPACFLAFAT